MKLRNAKIQNTVNGLSEFLHTVHLELAVYAIPILKSVNKSLLY